MLREEDLVRVVPCQEARVRLLRVVVPAPFDVRAGAARRPPHGIEAEHLVRVRLRIRVRARVRVGVGVRVRVRVRVSIDTSSITRQRARLQRSTAAPLPSTLSHSAAGLPLPRPMPAHEWMVTPCTCEAAIPVGRYPWARQRARRRRQARPTRAAVSRSATGRTCPRPPRPSGRRSDHQVSAAPRRVARC